MSIHRGCHGLELIKMAAEGLYIEGGVGFTKKLVDSLKRFKEEELVSGRNQILVQGVTGSRHPLHT